MAEEIIDVKKGYYACPNCGRFETDHTKVLEITERQFIEEPDPHLEWQETYKCDNCETKYRIYNGT